MKKAVIALTFVAVGAVAQQPVQQPAEQRAVPPITASDPGRYVGVASCVNSGCHGSTQPLNSTKVLQNEFYTWLDSDRHSQAYNVLFNATSARIARNMRLGRKPYEEAVCLDCHTTNVAPRLVAGAVDREDGVQCEACHGPASGWRNQHAEEGWTHEQSVARGMIDLRSLNTRGTLCAGCHVGSASKEVDHELIAAGHPLLTFELDNYTEGMPPHWTPGRDSHGVRAWAVGQVVKFRESLDNLSRHARGDEWPEFSDMSCGNCHHDLKSSQWRQERGWPDRAGLPSWSPQHWATLRLLLERISPASRNELDPLIREISTGVARMNRPAALAENADRARRIVEPLVAKADQMTWSEQDVRAMMRTIAEDERFILASDVQSAEQVALALQSLSSVLTRNDPRLIRGATVRAIDGLFEEVRNRDDYQPSRFAEKLARVRATL